MRIPRITSSISEPITSIPKNTGISTEVAWLEPADDCAKSPVKKPEDIIAEPWASCFHSSTGFAVSGTEELRAHAWTNSLPSPSYMSSVHSKNMSEEETSLSGFFSGSM